MSGERGSAEPDPGYPAEWLEEEAAGGRSVVSRVGTRAGRIELAIRRRHLDATAFELALALVPLPGTVPYPVEADAPDWVTAVREARRARSEPDPAWRARVAEVWPTLGLADRSRPESLLRKLRLHWPQDERPTLSTARSTVTMEMVFRTIAELKGEYPYVTPTQGRVAQALYVREWTLRRLLRDNGYARWPPVAPPDLQ